MNKKHVLVACTAISAMLIGVVSFAISKASIIRLNAANGKYTMTLNTSNAPELPNTSTSGNFSLNTTNGNPIQFDYVNLTGIAGYVGGFSNDSLLSNTTIITGMVSITATFTGGLVASYGLMNAEAHQETLASGTELEFPSTACYFKLTAPSAANLSSLTIKYDCSMSEDANKAKAIEEINAYVDSSLYYSEDQADIASYKTTAIAAVNSATNQGQIDAAVASYKASVDELNTIAEWKEINKVNFSTGSEANWEINYRNKTYKSLSANNQALMFANETFPGGTIEWDMKVPNDSYTYGTVCGIVYGAKTNNIPGAGENAGEDYHVMGRYMDGHWFVGYYKSGSEGGAFDWENSGQVPVTNASSDWVHYAMQYESELNRVTIWCSNGDYANTMYLKKDYGPQIYFGLYTEATGVEFKNIVVKNYFTGDLVDGLWTVSQDNVHGTVYKCTQTGNHMLGLNGIKFNGGTLEWDMKVPTNDYGDICGAYFGAISQRTIYKINIPGLIQDSYHTFGRFVNGDIYVGYYVYSLDDGSIDSNWENSGQILGAGIGNDWQHYKLIYDKANNKITLEINGLTSTYALSKAIDGQFVGFYSGCQGTEFANLTIS